MKTKSFKSYLEKRLNKNEIEEIEKEAILELLHEMKIKMMEKKYFLDNMKCAYEGGEDCTAKAIITANEKDLYVRNACYSCPCKGPIHIFFTIKEEQQKSIMREILKRRSEWDPVVKESLGINNVY